MAMVVMLALTMNMDATAQPERKKINRGEGVTELRIDHANCPMGMKGKRELMDEGAMQKKHDDVRNEGKNDKMKLINGREEYREGRRMNKKS